MSAQALDRAALAKLRTDLGDEASVRDILASYAEEAPPLMAQLVAAVRDGKAQELDHAAHTLKSMSATIGALGLAESCRALEQFGKRGDLGGAPPLAAEAEAELVRVVRALRDELGGPRAA